MSEGVPRMIHAFPKIFAVGQDYIEDLFQEEVEITEKIDGSQFNFGRVEGEVVARSKGKALILEDPEKLFSLGVDYVLSIQERLEDNKIYYCEYLRAPKHNVLAYERTPKNHLILFGVSTTTGKFTSAYMDLVAESERLGIEVVPLIFQGKIDKAEQLLGMLEADSILGNTKIEGVVVKNYYRPFLLGGQPIPLMMGKFVSEKFKEKHKSNWGRENTGKGKWQTFLESYRTEARWQKSIQHLRDSGELENSPRDIGRLIKAIKQDIIEEEKTEIMEFLWKQFSGDLLRKATSGFPEWYKEQLLMKSFIGVKRKE